MPRILQNVKHIVVVMFENRSLDTMLGCLYPEGSLPEQVLPADSSPVFDGIRSGMSNPPRSAPPVPVTSPVRSFNAPDPDPQETFDNVAMQILGPSDAADAPWPPMSGFVVNYETTSTHDGSQVMQVHAPEQLPVLSALARSYAVPDLSVEVDDLAEALDRVRSAGIPVEYGPAIEPWGVRRFYVRDPLSTLCFIPVVG